MRNNRLVNFVDCLLLTIVLSGFRPAESLPVALQRQDHFSNNQASYSANRRGSDSDLKKPRTVN